MNLPTAVAVLREATTPRLRRGLKMERQSPSLGVVARIVPFHGEARAACTHDMEAPADDQDGRLVARARRGGHRVVGRQVVVTTTTRQGEGCSPSTSGLVSYGSTITTSTTMPISPPIISTSGAVPLRSFIEPLVTAPR